jgi:hypothetical protein
MSGADVETRMEAIATRIEGSQAALEAAILDQSTLLRLFLDRLDKLLETQAPKDDSGPTMQEFLAEIVLRLGENTGVFQKRRFLLDDRRTESFRLFIGLNNYRLKTVRPCERL